MPTQQALYDYVGEVTRDSDQVSFGKRSIPRSQLELGRDLLRFRAERRGVMPADPNQAVVIEEPIFEDMSTGHISGIRMSIEHAGHCVEQTFDLNLFEMFFESQTADLLKAKQLASTDKVRFKAYANRRDESTTHGQNPARIHRKPLPIVDGDLAAFRANAQAVGPMDEDDYPVFVAETALERAFEIVWKRNEERGVWLIGNLYRQTDPVHEIFGVVHTVFQARGVEHSRFNLSLSAETFSHVDRQLALRRKRFGETGEMPLGFYHSHPFLPSILDGKESCPECPLRPTCDLTSTFFSKVDSDAFHIPYFGGAGYAIELVLGLTPREEFDLKMFCLDGGQFRERGFYRIAELPVELAPAAVTLD